MKSLKWILVLVIVWRLALLLVGSLGDNFVVYDPSFPYSVDRLAQYDLPRWLYSWANFDGVHYLTIAEKGYIGTGLIQAFFPIYPFLTGMLMPIFGSSMITGLLVSNFSLIAAVILFFILVRQHFDFATAKYSTFFLLLFPTSFFLGAMYSESLFLVWILASFIFMDKKQWLWATIFAGLAAATRLVGIFMIPALLIALLESEKTDWSPSSLINIIKEKWLIILGFALALVGLGAYMLFLNGEFHDPLYFFHVQSEFGSGRQENLILLPQVIWRALKIVFTVPLGLPLLTYIQELVFSIGTFTILTISWFQRKSLKIPNSWLTFSLLATLLPPLTGSFSSMPRYVLVAFPLYVILASWTRHRPIIRVILLAGFGLLLVFNTILFIQGHWIA
ncbi:MAG: hypothetical protein COY80_04740 [Candidatus Pacebacteria bacterium CG_4_10_14_0_8_um_filter_42_14]|nr:MAG: hypothetical protein COY80_04740 [Candidatus Pacebacteria bacterium CG_4_10_14_0_8_um_filter_42_14]